MADTESDFRMCIKYVRCVTELMLKDHFGDRCQTFEPGCECCKRWQLLDDLVESPYED